MRLSYENKNLREVNNENRGKEEEKEKRKRGKEEERERGREGKEEEKEKIWKNVYLSIP
jgi:hypothetical protein